MFNAGNSLLLKPGRIQEDGSYVWLLRTPLQKVFPSSGKTPGVKSEVQEGGKAEHWLSLNWLRVLVLPQALPGASVVFASWWLPQVLCQNRRGMQEDLVGPVEICPEQGQHRSVRLTLEKCTDCLVCRKGESLLFLWAALEMELSALVPCSRSPYPLAVFEG